jgi:hypothetical protein
MTVDWINPAVVELIREQAQRHLDVIKAHRPERAVIHSIWLGYHHPNIEHALWIADNSLVLTSTKLYGNDWQCCSVVYLSPRNRTMPVPIHDGASLSEFDREAVLLQLREVSDIPEVLHDLCDILGRRMLTIANWDQLKHALKPLSVEPTQSLGRSTTRT